MNNRVAYLVSKKLTCEITETEIIELNDYLMQDTTMYETIQFLESTWKHEHPTEQHPADIEKLLSKIRSSYTGFEATASETPQTPNKIANIAIGHRKSFNFKSLLRIAATLLLLVAASWWGYQFFATTPPPKSIAAQQALNEVITKPGNRMRVVLKDGTRVWLNADSKITYANDFDGITREVNLTGEAYFDVVSNPANPFIIHTLRTTVKVTGTTFNVRDYPGEARTETSLIKGKVEVYAVNQPDKIYYLEPNEKIILNSANPVDESDNIPKARQKMSRVAMAKIVYMNIDPIDSIPVEIAWVNNQLAFYNESFRDIANKMEKWYNTKIEFESGLLEKVRLTGKFEKESLPEALEALQITTPFRFKHNGETIYIFK